MKTTIRTTALGALAGALCLAVTPALAGTIGFSLNISVTTANGDRPSFNLVNMSDPGLNMVNFQMLIGDTSYNFDRIVSMSGLAGVGGSVVVGDAFDAGARTDLLEFAFTDFNPGEAFGWVAELDKDGFNDTSSNFRTVFFNNGGPTVANASGRATFSDGRVVTVSTSGETGQSSYTFAGLRFDEPLPPDLEMVPLPAALPLMAGALGLFGMIARRRRRA